MSPRRRGVQLGRVGVDTAAQELQTHELAQRERSKAVDTHALLSKCVGLVVTLAHGRERVVFRERLGVSLGYQRYVQQTGGRLAELARDEHALRTPGLEGHTRIIVGRTAPPNGAESQTRRRNVPNKKD